MSRHETKPTAEEPLAPEEAALDVQVTRLMDGVECIKDDLGTLNDRMVPKLVTLQENLEQLKAQTEGITASLQRLQEALDRHR